MDGAFPAGLCRFPLAYPGTEVPGRNSFNGSSSVKGWAVGAAHERWIDIEDFVVSFRSGTPGV